MKKLLALALLGVAVKYFLDSESGKEVKQQLKDWLGEAQDLLSDGRDKVRNEVANIASQID